MKEPDFSPAEGVDITTALRYIQAIEEAVKRDASSLDKSERSMMIGLIAGTMRKAADGLGEYRAHLEAVGLADPPTEEQLLQLRMIFRRALEKSEN